MSFSYTALQRVQRLAPDVPLVMLIEKAHHWPMLRRVIGPRMDRRPRHRGAPRPSGSRPAPRLRTRRLPGQPGVGSAPARRRRVRPRAGAARDRCRLRRRWQRVVLALAAAAVVAGLFPMARIAGSTSARQDSIPRWTRRTPRPTGWAAERPRPADRCRGIGSARAARARDGGAPQRPPRARRRALPADPAREQPADRSARR